MKRIIFSLAIFSGIAMVGLTACEKDDNPLTDAKEALVGTMSAKIDGNAWSSAAPGAIFSNNSIAVTGVASDDKSLVVSAFSQSTGTYDFSGSNIKGSAIYRIKVNDSTNNDYIAYNGQVEITEVNASNSRVSGTFSFDAVFLSTFDTVSVTEGEFTNVNYTTQ